MTLDSRIREQTRRAAVSAIRRGHLTAAEVADLAGTSRQLVHYWCTQAHVDPVRARQRYLAAEWTDAMAGYVRK
jgi:hypothetical protein